MTAPIPHSQIEEEFLARVTDIAYQALLRRGLRGSFVDAQLGLWDDIRSAYHDRRPVRLNESEESR